ncbi:MAG: T9SS type A sorting domain-containing protein [Rhodothermales bacterium]
MHRLVLLFLAVLLAVPSSAQEGTWDYYVPGYPGSWDGPSIARDGDNTWIAVQGGGSGGVEGALLRHDRRTGRVTTYTPFNSGLPSARIAALALGAEGELWVGIPWLDGGDGAIARFRDGAWTVYDAANTPELRGEVTTLHVDAAGALWVGTYGGILRFDGTAWTAYTTANSDFPLSYVRAIHSDESGVLWAGGWGLARFDGIGWTAWTPDNSDLPNDGMIALAVTGPDEVWAGTQQEGLVHLDAGEVTIYTRDEWPMDTIRPDRLAVAPDGSVWGTAGNLFRIVDDVLLEVETEGFSVSRTFVLDGDELWSWLAVAPEYEGQLGYVETTGGMVSAPTTFSLGPNDTWLPAVAWGPDGALYFGTQSYGVGRFDGRDWTHWHPYWTGLPDGRIDDLAVDRDGGLWAAPAGGGPARFDGEVWTEYTDGLPADLSGTRALAVVLEPGGTETMWAALERWGDAGQGAALARFNGTSWEWLTPSGVDLFSTYIHAAAGDADGNVWLATRDLGVVRTDGETAMSYTSADGLPTDYVTDIAVDAGGTVWATSPFGALARFDGAAWSVVPASATGVTEPASVAVDPQGGVWVGGESAAAQFDGETWRSFTSQNAPLPPADSLGGFPFVSIAPGPDGRVAFGTAFRGLFVYTPAGIVPAEDDAAAPAALLLEQSFPNPTADAATIRFYVPPANGAPVRLDVLDVLGRRVATLVEGPLAPGPHEVGFDASSLPTGTYLYRVSVGQVVVTRRLLVVH